MDIYIYVYCILYIHIYGIWIYVVKLNKHVTEVTSPGLWRVDARDLADLQLPSATQQLQRQQLQLQLDFKPAVTAVKTL